MTTAVATRATCNVDGCSAVPLCRGLCSKHYWRAQLPERDGHGQAKAAMLPSKGRGPGGDPATAITDDHRATARTMRGIARNVAALQPAGIAGLMELAHRIGGPRAFETAMGISSKEVQAVWRLYRDLYGTGEGGDEDE